MASIYVTRRIPEVGITMLKDAGHDVEPIQIFEGNAVETHAGCTRQRAQDPDVDAPKDGGEQMVDHQWTTRAEHPFL